MAIFRRHWLVLMPGLGGSPDHFRWLGRSLSRRGWSVLVLEHPGSDAVAVQALLEGRLPPPGAEVIPDRLLDLQAVLAARDNGEFEFSGERLVLAGHSLGALTALLAAGARPQEGLARRLRDKIWMTFRSTTSPDCCNVRSRTWSFRPFRPPEQLAAVVGLNSFGSLLWPRRLHLKDSLPVFLSGGTLDLITPPLSEQVGLLRALPFHPDSRAVLVEGASHFSPSASKVRTAPVAVRMCFSSGRSWWACNPCRFRPSWNWRSVNFC